MKVLVVDDEIVIRRGIVKLLEQPGGHITGIEEAKNGEEALNRLKTGRFDLLITDIQMPVMNGLQLIAKAREIYPELAIIVLSGYAEFQYVQQALRHQVSDYLLKPITGDKLQEVISRVLLNDPAKWTSSLDEVSIRLMKETVASLVKNVLAERTEESDAAIDRWGAHLNGRGHTLLEMKRIMGHFGLLFRSELMLAHKRPPGSVSIPVSPAASSPEELLQSWKLILREEIRLVAGSRAPRNKRIVDEAIAEISMRYGDASLNLSGLAENGGLSPAYLSKIFREVMKKPITQYISEFRLEKAKEMLLREDAPKINHIAEQCGFNDYPYFSKIFKKYYGVAPLEYKEKNNPTM